MFLGISIFDRYFMNVSAGRKERGEFGERREVRVVSCLWLAWKYLESGVMPLKALLEKVFGGKVQCGEVVEMESEILNGIEFQIPEDTPYCSLLRCF